MAEADPSRDELVQQTESSRCHFTHELYKVLATTVGQHGPVAETARISRSQLEIVDDIDHSLKQARALFQEVQTSGPEREG